MACEDNNVHNMSEICLEAWQKQEIHIIDNDCYPKYISPTVSTIATIWCTTNSIVGLSGNLLTLLAIPYVTRLKKRYFLIALISQSKIFFLSFKDYERVVDRLPLMTYGLKLSLEA